jgi:hypothetical protein
VSGFATGGFGSGAAGAVDSAAVGTDAFDELVAVVSAGAGSSVSVASPASTGAESALEEGWVSEVSSGSSPVLSVLWLDSALGPGASLTLAGGALFEPDST